MSQTDQEKRALLLAFAVFGMFWGAWAVLLPAVKADAGLSDGQLGLALGAIALGALPSMPLAGRLVDRLGAAKLVRLSLLAFGAVTPLPALAGRGGGLIVSFVLVGLTTGFLDVVINTATAAWERIEARRLMAACHGLFSAGMLLGSVGTGFARNSGAGPEQVLPVVAGLVVIAGLRQPSFRRPAVDEASAGRSRLGMVLLLLGALVAVSFLLEDAIQSWSALHLERDLHARPWVSGLGPGLFAAAMTAGRLGSHVHGARHSDGVVIAGGGGAVAVGAVLLAVAPAPVLVLVGVVLAGAGCSVLAPTLFSAVGARSAAGREGTALGAVSTLGYVGFLIGPPVIGLLSAATSLPVALGLLGLLGVGIGAAGPLVLRRPVRSFARLVP
ncbi:MAG: MFS transporter [Mycobacteriales bacterium]